MSTKELMWLFFKCTGLIDAYLLYRNFEDEEVSKEEDSKVKEGYKCHSTEQKELYLETRT